MENETFYVNFHKKRMQTDWMEYKDDGHFIPTIHSEYEKKRVHKIVRYETSL